MKRMQQTKPICNRACSAGSRPKPERFGHKAENRSGEALWHGLQAPGEVM